MDRTTVITPDAYTRRRAQDFRDYTDRADLRFRDEGGKVYYPGTDGCWVDAQAEVHNSGVLSLLLVQPEDELTRLREQVATLTEERDQKARHIVQIREGLIAEAQERDWCDEVNDFLEGVNLEPWRTDYTVTVTGTFTVDVACRSDDDADSFAWDRLRDWVNGRGGVGLGDLSVNVVEA